MKFKRPVGRAGVANLAQRRQEKNGKTKVSRTSNRNKSRVRYIDDMSTDDDTEDEELEEFFDWCSYINTFDVCLTTYNVLQQDLTVARPPPVRPRRSGATYTNTQKHRSPLALCEWYRVMMDEVQMAGGGKTEFRLFFRSLFTSLTFLKRNGFSDSTHFLLRYLWHSCKVTNIGSHSCAQVC